MVCLITPLRVPSRHAAKVKVRCSVKEETLLLEDAVEGQTPPQVLIEPALVEPDEEGEFTNMYLLTHHWMWSNLKREQKSPEQREKSLKYPWRT